ncbi:hypothetical protein [Synechococcus sp. CC9616]|uniref:hypothetical protein n=1 Tax=Synechococcus sp. CC9616 TaxID=110663 RepID=UPI0004BA2F3F|nr:hypothetical protein [Synechococcus sp. CC9616]
MRRPFDRSLSHEPLCASSPAFISSKSAELGAVFDEMNDAGALSNVETNASALTTLMGMGSQQESKTSSGF